MRLDHAIFRGPLSPKLEMVDFTVPAGYRDHPAGKDLPETIKAWKVQEGALGKEIDYGLVSDPYGFEDSPDAEWISSGDNSKGPRSVALGRHGNFFLWGFGADPTQLTESGRHVFLNVLHYMKGFAGKTALVERKLSSRDWAPLYVSYVEKYKDSEDERLQGWIRKIFGEKIRAETQLESDKLEKYLAENMEFLRHDGQSFVRDDDLAALGVSGRKPAFFPAVLARLEKDAQDELALRLVERYLAPAGAPSDPGALAKWLDEKRERLFFSDVGGYRWFVSPK